MWNSTHFFCMHVLFCSTHMQKSCSPFWFYACCHDNATFMCTCVVSRRKWWAKVGRLKKDKICIQNVFTFCAPFKIFKAPNRFEMRVSVKWNECKLTMSFWIQKLNQLVFIWKEKRMETSYFKKTRHVLWLVSQYIKDVKEELVWWGIFSSPFCDDFGCKGKEECHLKLAKET